MLAFVGSEENATAAAVSWVNPPAAEVSGPAVCVCGTDALPVVLVACANPPLAGVETAPMEGPGWAALALALGEVGTVPPLAAAICACTLTMSCLTRFAAAISWEVSK